MKALVLKSTGSWYDVLADDNVVYKARTRGKMRLEIGKETNPIAVGDYVFIETQNKETIIHETLPRANYIVRKSVKKTEHKHVIAANIDLAMLMITLTNPRTSLGFIDRFIVAAESFRIPQVLVFNKLDLLTDIEQAEVDALMSLYTSINVACIGTSAIDPNQQQIKNKIEGKKTLLAGHSGVGKSTLINSLSDQIHQKTNPISDFSSKGIHTTTFAEMFCLNEHTFIIDTPGIKELGLVDMHPEEISDYFVEMRSLREQCKFGARCIHINEPNCAVRDALSAGKIPISRYKSYVSIIKDEDNRR